MAQFVKVGTNADFALDGGKLVEAGGQKIAVFTSTRLTIPVRIEAGLWQKVWSKAT